MRSALTSTVIFVNISDVTVSKNVNYAVKWINWPDGSQNICYDCCYNVII